MSVSINHYSLIESRIYGLSIGTNIGDLEWPWTALSISNNSHFVCSTGARLVEVTCCQFALTTTSDCDVSRLFTLYYCTILAVLVTSDTARLSRYRYLTYGGVWHAQPTLDMDPVQGTTVCEVTAMERGTSCGKSVVVGTSRQRSLFIPRIPQAPTSLLTDSCTWRRRDEEVRKTFAFL